MAESWHRCGRRCTTRPDIQRGIWVNGSAFRSTVYAGNIKFRSPASDGTCRYFPFSIVRYRSRCHDFSIRCTESTGCVSRQIIIYHSNSWTARFEHRAVSIWLLVGPVCKQASFSPANCDSMTSRKKNFARTFFSLFILHRKSIIAFILNLSIKQFFIV